jgi:hypothetical protein
LHALTTILPLLRLGGGQEKESLSLHAVTLLRNDDTKGMHSTCLRSVECRQLQQKE